MSILKLFEWVEMASSNASMCKREQNKTERKSENSPFDCIEMFHFYVQFFR